MMVEFTNNDLSKKLMDIPLDRRGIANEICKLLVGKGLSFYQAQTILDYAKALLGKVEI